MIYQLINSRYLNIDVCYLLGIFAEYGHGLCTNHIQSAIMSNEIEIVKYAIEKSYDIQATFNDCDFVDSGSNGNLSFSYETTYQSISRFSTNKSSFSFSIQMLNLLIESGIDVSRKLDGILIYGAEHDDIDLVTYCIENNITHSINMILLFSINSNHLDIITYLLENGADLNEVDSKNIYGIEFSTAQILTKHGYKFDSLTINNLFIRSFLADDDLEHSYYLINHGADANCICDRESRPCRNDNTYVVFTKEYLELNSYLEHLVVDNKLLQMEYLAQNHFHKLKSELDRLFVVAMANGHIRMGLYLLDLGADLHYQNNQALIWATFFGHVDSVNLLIERGVILDGMTKNLFMIVICGYIESNSHTIGPSDTYYDKLINNFDIFKNDEFCSGNGYLEIFKLFIMHQVKIPTYKIFQIMPENFYDEDIFTYLVANGIDLNQELVLSIPGISRNAKATVLVLSILFDKYAVTKILLEAGSDPKTYDNRAIKIAMNMKLTNVVDLLMKYGAECEPL
jgi:ankyrin repeat protein